jgi:hypothetical protein
MSKIRGVRTGGQPAGFSGRGRLGTAIVALTLISGVMATPAMASVPPLACGDTIVADTTLRADLLSCEGNGLVIGADGILLNLNGHVVAGNGVQPRDRVDEDYPAPAVRVQHNRGRRRAVLRV